MLKNNLGYAYRRRCVSAKRRDEIYVLTEKSEILGSIYGYGTNEYAVKAYALSGPLPRKAKTLLNIAISQTAGFGWVYEDNGKYLSEVEKHTLRMAPLCFMTL